MTAAQPDLRDGLEMRMAITKPPPKFHIAEAIRHARESGAQMPTWLVASVDVRRHRNPADGNEGDPAPWTDGIKMADPQDPEMTTGFGTEDGDLRSFVGLAVLIEHVAAIVERFGSLGSQTMMK